LLNFFAALCYSKLVVILEATMVRSALNTFSQDFSELRYHLFGTEANAKRTEKILLVVIAVSASISMLQQLAAHSTCAVGA
jgi:hypothetical protein